MEQLPLMVRSMGFLMRLIILLLLLIPCYAQATYYWVSPTGTKTVYTDCDGASPPADLANHCSLAGLRGVNGINANIADGDTVYFRNGSYTDTDGSTLIDPGTSGSSTSSRITYSAYGTEVPVITNVNVGTAFYAVALDGNDYIVVSGLTFVDFPRHIILANGADYNEIRYNTVYRTSAAAGAGTGALGRFIQVTGNTTPSTHNWIHHNTLHTLYNAPCGEGGDGIMIGDTGDEYDSNNNTIEYNTLYHISHAPTENFTQYNVFRGNVSHNDGFKTFTANLTGTATGGSTTTMVDTSKNFTDIGVMEGSFLYVHDMSDPGSGQAKRAIVTSISTTTNANDTLNFSIATGTPNFANGHNYSIGCAYFADSNPPGNGKYGHRAFHLDSHANNPRTGEDYLLFEGNRGGHSASNPGNDGADGLSLSAGKNIVRYNSFYGNAGPGLHFKNAVYSSNNMVYNNTIYSNGIFQGTQDVGNPITTYGIQIDNGSASNVLKNNIIYGNSDGAFDVAIPETWTVSNNWCPDAISGCIEAYRSTDPLFVNTNITTMDDVHTSTYEFDLPNLTLSSGSLAINGGAALTTVHASDTGSGTDLYVTDSRYFQDGTWGSSLARLSSGLGGTFQADWICVGTVSNCVQISTVSYTAEGEGDYEGAYKIVLTGVISRSDGNSIWLYKKSDGVRVLYGTAPDIGAHEYNPSSDKPTATIGSGSVMSIGSGATATLY